MQIFDKKLKEKGFNASEDARILVENIMKKAKEVENFGNGRFVENTVQKVIVEHAVKTRNIEDKARLLNIEAEDIPKVEAELNCLVAEDSAHHVCGFLFYDCSEQTKVGFIKTIAVDEKYRNKGIGSELMEAALAVFKAHNVYLVVTSV